MKFESLQDIEAYGYSMYTETFRDKEHDLTIYDNENSQEVGNIQFGLFSSRGSGEFNLLDVFSNYFLQFDYHDRWKLIEEKKDEIPEAVYLSFCYTNDEYMGQGFGSVLMEEMVNFCDETYPNIPIILCAQPYRSWSSDRAGYLEILINFYSKFGFEVTGVDEDDMEFAYMVRQ